MPGKEHQITPMDKTYITVVKYLPDYENDPVFIKKREDAYKDLKEAPLPDVILKRIEKSH